LGVEEVILGNAVNSRALKIVMIACLFGTLKGISGVFADTLPSRVEGVEAYDAWQRR
jgi:hypothetical protein